jgi:hypothetical protein
MWMGACIAGAALMLLAACTGSAAGDTVAPSTAPVAGGTAARGAATAPPQAPLRVVKWGVNDQMLSVLIENRTDETIRSAHVVITARDSRGTIIASVSGPPGALCCTIIALRPHATFGLFADFGPGVARTAKVDVDYSQVSVAAESTGGDEIAASGGRLERRGDLTLVDAYLTSPADVGPYVAVQAVLSDPSGGRMVAVISGRFYCLFPGRQLAVTMQLFHPVPLGTRIESVSAFPIPSDLAAVTSDLPRCEPG